MNKRVSAGFARGCGIGALAVLAFAFVHTAASKDDKPEFQIEVGKLADLVVLDRDYFSVSDADMHRTRPVLTGVSGRIVYDAAGLS